MGTWNHALDLSHRSFGGWHRIGEATDAPCTFVAPKIALSRRLSQHFSVRMHCLCKLSTHASVNEGGFPEGLICEFADRRSDAKASCSESAGESSLNMGFPEGLRFESADRRSDAKEPCSERAEESSSQSSGSESRGVVTAWLRRRGIEEGSAQRLNMMKSDAVRSLNPIALTNILVCLRSPRRRHDF